MAEGDELHDEDHSAPGLRKIIHIDMDDLSFLGNFAIDQ